MKAVVKTATGPGALELREVDRPVPDGGQVLLAVRAAALCGTDVLIAHGSIPVRAPLILGHELAGVVAEVGAGVVGVAVGQRVTTETDASFCGVCAFCRAGNQHLCPSRTAIGTSSPGGLADFVAIPASGVHPLPDGVDFVAGALTEPLAVAVRAVVERGAVEADDEVVVIGPGTIGLLVAQVAMSRGATVTVAGLDRHKARFRLARELGVPRTAALDVPTSLDAIAGGHDGLGVDVVIECAGASDAVAAGLRLLRKGGRMILVAFTPGSSRADGPRPDGPAGARDRGLAGQAPELLRDRSRPARDGPGQDVTTGQPSVSDRCLRRGVRNGRTIRHEGRRRDRRSLTR